MKPMRPRRLAFELLEPKASPSALLLALAPLDEAAQRLIESTSSLAAAPTATPDTNAALLRFIAENTRSDPWRATMTPLPTPEQAAAADTMMQATDTDLRAMLIAEMLDASSADGNYVFSVIQF